MSADVTEAHQRTLDAPVDQPTLVNVLCQRLVG
jgi:hypothetical protein